MIIYSPGLINIPSIHYSLLYYLLCHSGGGGGDGGGCGSSSRLNLRVLVFSF